jgi:DNA-binding NtrC family response regulator
MGLANLASLKILVVDDDSAIQRLLESRLSRKGHAVVTAESVPSAREKIKQQDHPFDVVITDLRMPGESGFEILTLTRVPVIIMTGHGDKESAILAVEKGAFGFLEKPFDLDALEFHIQRAVEKTRLEIERNGLLEELGRICRLQSREIEAIAERTMKNKTRGDKSLGELIQKLSKKSTSTVLILGESGTGKEVLAREIHHETHPTQKASDSYDRAPFVAINCSAIPVDLLESEIFGHEKGAFSGAHNTKVGLAEVAREGTLFLDEIGDMDIRHQAKVLRLLQERIFRRVGGTRDLSFQGRIIAATHRHLETRIGEGLFREDLFYRLSIVTLTCPPLRLRGEQIFEIADNICKKFGLRGIAPERLAELKTYHWPGNIRELHNWIERAAILTQVDEEGWVNAEVPGLGAASSYRDTKVSLQQDYVLKSGETIKEARNRVLDQLDKVLIQQSLLKTKGNLSEAARLIGLDRKNLSRRIAELGLKSSTSPKKSA